MESNNGIQILVQFIQSNDEKLLELWLQEMTNACGEPVMTKIRRDELQNQTKQLLEEFRNALGENFGDFESGNHDKLFSILREISASRAKKGFTPTQTVLCIYSFKNALLHLMQKEVDFDPKLLFDVLLHVERIIDRLGLVTFEFYVESREHIIREQNLSLMELSTPVIKLWEGILLLPLIGIVDTIRARQITERLLEAIVQTESLITIIDVTGVPVLDTGVAGHLIKTIAAANMLGTRVVLTGISSEGAQTLVKLGIDLSCAITRGSLRSGIAEGLRMVDKKIVSCKRVQYEDSNIKV